MNASYRPLALIAATIAVAIYAAISAGPDGKTTTSESADESQKAAAAQGDNRANSQASSQPWQASGSNANPARSPIAADQAQANDSTSLFHDYQVLKGPPGQLSQRGRDLIDRAAAYHREQVRHAEQILATGTSPAAINDFAERVATDHRSAYDKLELLSKLHEIKLPEVTAKDEIKAPTGGSNASFGEDPGHHNHHSRKGSDQQPSGQEDSTDSGSTAVQATTSRFIEEQIAAHRRALTRLEHLAGRTGSLNLDSYIKATRPVVEAHLTIARRIKAEAQAADGKQTLVERGRYLAHVGDCKACHTRKDGQPYAGGRRIETPYGGYFVSPNITPSPQGIGGFSDEEFLDAMHRGERPDGQPYYPAFPYPSYTKASEEDVLAIKAYLDTIQPSSNEPGAHELPWPIGIRETLYAWQEAFFDAARFEPDPSQPDTWNRGAYLVEGLGHCGACHSPRNLLGAEDDSRTLTGATREGWYAPSLTPGLGEGIDHYSVEQLVELLQTGMAETKESDAESDEGGPASTLLGPMAEVVHSSLSHLTREDVKAMAIYLKHRAPVEARGEDRDQKHRLAPDMAKLGESIYWGHCAACHRNHGQGQPPYIPSLRHNPVLNEAKANNLVMSILTGSPGEASQALSPYVSMPSYLHSLDDIEISAVAGYLRARWGDEVDPRVAASLVAQLRNQVRSASSEDADPTAFQQVDR
ncbi:MAG: c-type cytochrome [Lamprobacter sp.]|uniref:c-type cytochrome n=1 Tax=Lamprobacter sp. TaxID=3100796 RepID=UPI002B257A28|nr:c-type cytochrome [Lamprobacter sp.]MEA3642335.1 c-type cytochrome [Lamprobacter sp.]